VRAALRLGLEQFPPLCDRMRRACGDRVRVDGAKTRTRRGQTLPSRSASPLKQKSGLSGPPTVWTNPGSPASTKDGRRFRSYLGLRETLLAQPASVRPCKKTQEPALSGAEGTGHPHKWGGAKDGGPGPIELKLVISSKNTKFAHLNSATQQHLSET